MGATLDLTSHLRIWEVAKLGILTSVCPIIQSASAVTKLLLQTK